MGKMGTMWNMNKTSHTIQKQKGEWLISDIIQLGELVGPDIA